MSNIQLSRLGMYETYNATAEIEGGTRYTRAFVSHEGRRMTARHALGFAYIVSFAALAAVLMGVI